MRITAFTGESGEPETVDHKIDCIGPDEDATTFGELAQLITNLQLSDIHVVSENVATIALHALWGILKATDESNIIGLGNTVPVREARAWALAALRELAFYDVDGILVEDMIGPDGTARSHGNPSFHGDEPMASDPGRDALNAVRNGTHREHGVDFYVQWPDA